MIRISLFSIILVLLTSGAFGQAKSKYYPFTMGDKNEITAFIETAPLYPHFKDIFEKYGFSGSGESWAGIIQQILEKQNPDLLKHIRFDPEAGAFFAYADSKKTQLLLIQLLAPIFADDTKLEVWLKKADHKRISD